MLPILDCDNVTSVHAQNLQIDHPKAVLLPIGIANAMWPHGNLETVYTAMRKWYIRRRKPRSVYVNINASTHPFRKKVLDAVNAVGLVNSQSRPFTMYLDELGSHEYCLCVRGNGIDTHRLWEALYLGVVPIIVIDEPNVFYQRLTRTLLPVITTSLDDLPGLLGSLSPAREFKEKYQEPGLNKWMRVKM
jgi:hypothetical protein